VDYDYYSNPAALVAYWISPLAIPVMFLVAYALFRIAPGSQGIVNGLLLAVWGTVFFSLNLFEYTGIGIAQSRVWLHAPLMNRVLVARQVREVEIVPPPKDFSTTVHWSSRLSHLVIHKADGKRLNIGSMPGLIAERVAETLSP